MHARAAPVSPLLMARRCTIWRVLTRRDGVGRHLRRQRLLPRARQNYARAVHRNARELHGEQFLHFCSLSHELPRSLLLRAMLQLQHGRIMKQPSVSKWPVRYLFARSLACWHWSMLRLGAVCIALLTCRAHVPFRACDCNNSCACASRASSWHQRYVVLLHCHWQLSLNFMVPSKCGRGPWYAYTRVYTALTVTCPRIESSSCPSLGAASLDASMRPHRRLSLLSLFPSSSLRCQ